MKTYQTTPRDELLGMGKVALGSQLQSCLRKRDELQRQKDYEITASEARVREMQGQLTAMSSSFGELKNTTKQNRAELQDQKAALVKEVDTLERDVDETRKQYNAQFKEWYDAKDAMSKQLAALSRCKACATMSEVVVLRQLTAAATSPVRDRDRDYMFDTAAKVEDCETVAIALADEISAAQARSRQATDEAVGKIEAMKRAAVDQQRLGVLMSVKPQIEALEHTKAALTRTLENWKSKYDSCKTATDDLVSSLNKLDA
eukprot:CAMPEP_0170208830 /NCGR_PEP_ID=MMETSP0116_2-20130129/4001_1 /TAXON_ID=400756 /ORGANISM="Durinskia baltica, Strain CSIRO CS-38" /LENGTH=259 /DNA_ID=CAMNT_0010459305 /DNA_START=90 /DNA_END=866 /DNA_ORIENTATION=-